MFTGYSANENRALSLATVDPGIEIGTELRVVWGEPDGGRERPPSTRGNGRRKFSGTVSPVPYSERRGSPTPTAGGRKTKSSARPAGARTYAARRRRRRAPSHARRRHGPPRCDPGGAAARPGSSAGGGSRRAARRSTSSRPAAGPLASPTATARLSSTTGESVSAGELAVERGDLRPVARLAPAWSGRSPPGRVRPVAVGRQRAVEHGAPLAIWSRVPERAVLVVEQHELAVAVRAARRESCSSISASRPGASASSGMSSASARPSRSASPARSRAAGVALVEDQVHDARTASSRSGSGGRAARGKGSRPRILRLARTSRWASSARHQEGARDLLGREAAERPQRERDLGVGRQRRVAAGEDQLRRSSGKPSSSIVPRPPRTPRSGGAWRPARGRDGCGPSAAARGGHEPGAWGWTGCRPRPALRGDRERFRAASSARSKSPRKPISAARTRPHWSRNTQSRIGYQSCVGRISIAPPMLAAGTFAAISIAASRSSASKMQ